MSSLLRAARRIFRTPSPPRLFPQTGFNVIDNAYLVEEETWEWYTPDEFYPVRIGEVFNSQYQVVGKLGYGAYATVWLCRDLMDHRHVAMKIGAYRSLSRELSVMKYLRTIRTRHAGTLLVRDMLDEFQVTNNNQQYQAIVHTPSGITLGEYRNLMPDKSLNVRSLRLVLKHVFISLDFLHTEANMVHTDIQEKNILLGLNPESAENDLEDFERREIECPSQRKIDGDRVIHTSQPLGRSKYIYGRPMLADFGEARFGEYDPMIDIQPYPYRAPEVILNVPWDAKVDIWNVGVLIWDLFEGGNLFNTRGGPENKENSVYHLAHMVALLGRPPRDFLERTQTDRPWQWFDSDGNWKGAADIPNTSLEDSEKVLEGENKARFLQFVRKMLKWKPEERESAQELLKVPWLNAVE